MNFGFIPATADVEVSNNGTITIIRDVARIRAILTRYNIDEG